MLLANPSSGTRPSLDVHKYFWIKYHPAPKMCGTRIRAWPLSLGRLLHSRRCRPTHGSLLPRAVESGEVAPSYPKIHLCERMPSHVVASAAVLAWRKEAVDRIADIGNSLSKDGGPTQEELHIELEWLMEDVVGQARDDGSEWLPVKWKDVVATMSMGETSIPLKLRLSLSQLHTLYCTCSWLYLNSFFIGIGFINAVVDLVDSSIM